jgi:hypothetical protein
MARIASLRALVLGFRPLRTGDAVGEGNGTCVAASILDSANGEASAWILSIAGLFLRETRSSALCAYLSYGFRLITLRQCWRRHCEERMAKSGIPDFEKSSQ